MPNGVLVIIKQGDLVNETTNVIVNPSNPNLIHGRGVAKAIALSARRSLEDECNAHIRQY